MESGNIVVVFKLVASELTECEVEYVWFDIGRSADVPDLSNALGSDSVLEAEVWVATAALSSSLKETAEGSIPGTVEVESLCVFEVVEATDGDSVDDKLVESTASSSE